MVIFMQLTVSLIHMVEGLYMAGYQSLCLMTPSIIMAGQVT